MIGPEEPPTRLRVPPRTADAAIRERLAIGESLLGRRPGDGEALARLTADYQQWSGENRDLLRSLYSTEGPCSEYSAFHGRPAPRAADLPGQIEELRNDIITKLSRLGTILWRTVTAAHGVVARQGAGGRPDDRVLLVHEPGDSDRERVERLLRALGLEILGDPQGPGAPPPASEPPAGYAIVMLPAAPAPGLGARLGYLLGTLGTGGVTVLRSQAGLAAIDLSGIPCLMLDEGGAWKVLLARELRRAGLRVDPVRAFAEG